MKTSKKLKKIMMLFTMLLAVLTMTAAVSAAKKPTLLGNGNRFYYAAKDQKQHNKQPLYFLQKGDKITKIQSSNKSVAAIYNGSYYKQKAVMLNVKKPGKTTFTVWVKNGTTTYKLRKTFTFYKSDAFKTVKIGSSKNLSAMLNGYHAKSSNYVKGKAGILSGTVTVKMNNGWKLKSLQIATNHFDDGTGETAVSLKNIKNGSKITLRADEESSNASDFDYLRITYVNTRTKTTYMQEIGVN